MNFSRFLLKSPTIQEFSKLQIDHKRTAGGVFDKFKSRLVTCGNEEKGLVLNTFSPVVYFTAVRLLLSISAQENYVIGQLDVKNAFLNSPVARAVYIELPKEHAQYSRDQVCLLRKSIYGLKDALRLWFKLLENIKALLDGISTSCTRNIGILLHLVIRQMVLRMLQYLKLTWNYA